MIRVSTQAQPERLAPLLHAACMCRAAPKAVCMACLRWARLYRAVLERRRAWRAQP